MSTFTPLRAHVHRLLDVSDGGQTALERVVEWGLIGLVLLNATTVVLASVRSWDAHYPIESDAQPDKFGSIPDTMWWGAAILTTVGHGDVFSITPAGKVLSSVIAVLGLGLFAIPTGIPASGFSEQLQEQHVAENHFNYCPNYGHKF